ncbi:Ig-like domain-containing protein, partial [Paenibacillus dendrobii]|uniref:Ig-like domain-containing protein n=1 Tax=Paenibacillus dendrobii TaxID=2691084 RepID=UPI00137185A6
MFRKLTMVMVLFITINAAYWGVPPESVQANGDITISIPPELAGYSNAVDPFSTNGDITTGYYYVGYTPEVGQDITALKFDLSSVAGKKITGATLKLDVNSIYEMPDELFVDLKYTSNDFWSSSLPAKPWTTIYRENDIPKSNSPTIFEFDVSSAILPIVLQELNGDGKITFLLEGNSTIANGGSSEMEFIGKQSKLVLTYTSNTAPVAEVMSVNTNEDMSKSGTLLAHDDDADPLTYSIVSPPMYGAVTITNALTGAFTYTPNPNMYGSDWFTFKVNDGWEDSPPATVTVQVSGVNDAPMAVSGSLSVQANGSNNGVLQATDVENDPLTYRIASVPTKGVAVITNAATGAYTYTPNPNATGSDSFTFVANDGSLDSNVATINVTITEAVDPPPVIIGQPGSATIAAGGNVFFLVMASNATGYQWQVDQGSGYTNISNGAPYSGATTAILTITGATS